jgi:menaquinol-cytochrome c reductase iron-sulfur subunit
MNHESGMGRRTFYLTCIYGLWALMGSIFAVFGGVYLFFPPRPRKDAQWVEAGDLSDLEPNQPVEMVFRRNRVDGWKIVSEKVSAWVVKQDNGAITAFAPQCTHLGCAYHWDAKKREFLCPCHASRFSTQGEVLSGPASRPLDRYEAKVEDGKILLGGIHPAGKTSS